MDLYFSVIKYRIYPIVPHKEEIIYTDVFVILYWNVDVFTLLYKFTKFCIEFLLLICFIYFTMQKM